MSLSIREPVGENELRKLLYDLGIPNIFDALSEWGIRDIFALEVEIGDDRHDIYKLITPWRPVTRDEDDAVKTLIDWYETSCIVTTVYRRLNRLGEGQPLRCNICQHSSDMILGRGRKFYLDDSLDKRNGGWVCRSCRYPNIKCFDCGFSEDCSISMGLGAFISDNNTWPPVKRCWRCECSNDIEDLEVEFEEEEITICIICGGVECMCMNELFANEYEIIEEENIIEDSEKKIIMEEALQELGEYIYEIKDDISNGQYLGIMNSLKKINDNK